MNRAQIESRIAELKVENEKAPGGAGTNARAELIRELEAQLPSSAGSARALAEELREYTAMKYAGDCKCGKCQLVPRVLVERIYHTLNSTFSLAQAAVVPVALRDACERLIAALEGLRPLPLVLDAMAKGLIADARAALASQPSPAATVEAKSAPVFKATQQAESDPAVTPDCAGAGTQCSAGSEGEYWRDQLNGCWDRSKADALKRAAEKALNYIKNTENELGIKLSCGDALREVLK